MFLPKRFKRSPQVIRDEADAIIERAKTEPPLELEKGDLKAMFLAGLVVFVPFLLALIVPILLLYWFIFNVWGG